MIPSEITTSALRGSVGPAAGASVAPSPSALTVALTVLLTEQCSFHLGLLFLLTAAALLSLGYALYERRTRLLCQIHKVKEEVAVDEWKRPALEIPMTPEEECEAGLDSGLRKRRPGSAKSSVSSTGIVTRDVWVKEN